MLSKFNGTSAPKGSYRAKTGDNDCNVNSSRYSLSTALCESICSQVKSEQNVRQDLIPRVRHVEAALYTPLQGMGHLSTASICWNCFTYQEWASYPRPVSAGTVSLTRNAGPAIHGQYLPELFHLPGMGHLSTASICWNCFTYQEWTTCPPPVSDRTVALTRDGPAVHRQYLPELFHYVCHHFVVVAV